MPNLTVRANARTMPINRRAALGSLAGVGAALLAAPRSARGEGLDAELFVLTRKANALEADLAAAEEALDAAYERLSRPEPPAALLAQERDREIFSNARLAVGQPLGAGERKAAKHMRHVWTRMLKEVEFYDTEYGRRLLADLWRVAEVEAAAERHATVVRDAELAAGVTEAEAEIDRLRAEQGKLWHAIAFTPTRTREGVLAKLGAIAASVGSYPFDLHGAQQCDAATVAECAAADLFAILQNAKA